MFAVVYAPGFALQASLRHEPELRTRPVAMVDDTAKPPLIFQMTNAARKAGVRKGMTSSQGLARCGALLTRLPTPEGEKMASAALWQCAASVSPYLEATEKGICTLDLKGLGAARGWWKGLVEQLRRQELEVKIGVAATPDLALLAAQNARPFLEIDERKGLQDLPLSALQGSPGLFRMLRRLGLRRMGEFCALAPEEVAERFGQEGLAHWQRATGKSTRLLKWMEPPETFEEGIEFEQEIELLEPLLFMARRFLDQIVARLDAAYLVVQTLELRIGFTSGPAYERSFAIPSPTREVETLFRMLTTHLENFRSEHPIQSLYLAARPGKGVKEQLGLFETSLRDPNQFHQTLGQLSALLGEDRVGTPVNENSFRADAFELQAPVFGGGARWETMAADRGLCLRRFRPPRRARILTMNGRPVSLGTDNFVSPIGETACLGRPPGIGGSTWAGREESGM